MLERFYDKKGLPTMECINLKDKRTPKNYLNQKVSKRPNESGAIAGCNIALG
jgi:hypothetical protein